MKNRDLLIGRPGRARALLTAGLAIILTVPGAAGWAYFLSGTGTASAKSATLSSLTVTARAQTSQLYPGTSTPVTLVVNNPNSVSLQFSSVTLDTTQGTSGFAIDSTHSAAGCTAASAALSFTPVSTGWTVPASMSGYAISLSGNILSMGLTAPSACQGATITLYLAVK